MTCERCHGVVLCERVNPFDWWWRCVNCGDRVDRVILRNRAEQGAALARQRDAERRDMREWADWFAPTARAR